jgi:2,3-bisphosphoglycerate-independent phosphoglycerate mutase
MSDTPGFLYLFWVLKNFISLRLYPTIPEMKKVCLIILDGFGLGRHDAGDAIFHSHKKFLEPLLESESFSRLKTDGESVGLPGFQCGGSEAGHITIGAGRAVKQFLTIIDDDMNSGNIMKNPALVPLFEKAKKRGRIHFVGMLSDGGIHSFQSHLHGLLNMSKSFGIENAFVHGFLDGRDVEERSAKKYLSELNAVGIGKIASLGGRFYAMDRDNNWDRVEKACNTIYGKSDALNIEAETVIDQFYNSSDKSDYYMPPVLLNKDGAIQKDDIVVCFNYRSDRMRQLWSALCDGTFSEFDRPFRVNPKNVAVFGSYYSDAMEAYKLEDPQVPNTLGEIVSKSGLSQLRISETEKFNHVTFYFSGQRKEEFPGEDRILIPSPKCASYAEKPEMSAREQTDALIQKVKEKDYSLIVQNFANSDLVGHGGVLKSAQEAVEVVDECLEKEIPVLHDQGYDVLLFADHGNADEMLEIDGSPCASHTKNLIPCWLLKSDGTVATLCEKGTLQDIAPTALELLGIEQPIVMTGKSLIVK